MVYFLGQGYKLRKKKRKKKELVGSLHANCYLKGRGQITSFLYNSNALPVMYLQHVGFLFPNMLFFSPDGDPLRNGIKGKDIQSLICFLNPLATLHKKNSYLTFGERIIPTSYQLDHHPFHVHQHGSSVSRSHESLLSLHNYMSSLG